MEKNLYEVVDCRFSSFERINFYSVAWIIFLGIYEVIVSYEAIEKIAIRYKWCNRWGHKI